MTASDVIYISKAHFTLMDAKGHFKLLFVEKVLYLRYDKGTAAHKYCTVALRQAAKMSIKGSYKGSFGGVNAVSHIGSGQNIKTNIIAVLTKDGTEVLVATGFSLFQKIRCPGTKIIQRKWN